MAVCLPHDIIFDEILTRLTVKDLLRFKSVCKLWCKAIGGPCFVKAHLHRWRSLPPGYIKESAEGKILVRHPYWGKIHVRHHYCFYNDVTEEYLPINIKDIFKRGVHFDLLASCDGLLVVQVTSYRRLSNVFIDKSYYVCIDKDTSYYVCNPVIRSSKKLPLPPEIFSKAFFIYNSTVNQYMIIGWGEDWGGYLVFTFGGSKTGSWKKFSLPKPIAPDPPYMFKGWLHGVVCSLEINKTLIFLLNTTTGEAEEITLSDSCGLSQYRFLEVTGSLYLLSLACDEHYRAAWILEDWEKKKWTKLHQKTFWSCKRESCQCKLEGFGSDYSTIPKNKCLLNKYSYGTDVILNSHINSLLSIKQLSCGYLEQGDQRQNRKRKRKRQQK
ncbi:hypothetical protein IFM89_001629 [Coptis chinensis]|uniref:F-box domain-containing protein n=1 Tax=Coptis chinensis TaxID=261450 RepID=A0A835HMM3_9MAGN|nr:hypothetical protein IFM89_001629 [Coptis chinensis]